MKKFNKYTLDEIEKKVNFFFQNLPEVYELIVDNYFSEFAENLLFFNGSTTLLIELNLKDQESRNQFDFHSIIIYGLQNEEEKELNIQIFSKSQNKMPPRPNPELNKNGLEFNGKQYKIVYWIWRRLDFLFKDSPILRFVYEMIMEKLPRYKKIHDTEFIINLFKEIKKKFSNFEMETS